MTIEATTLMQEYRIVTIRIILKDKNKILNAL